MKLRSLSVYAAALLASTAALSGSAFAQQPVKIGILNDQSGVYADFGGKWSLEAAKWRWRISAARCSTG